MKKKKLVKGLTIVASWTLLAAILACGGDTDDNDNSSSSTGGGGATANGNTISLSPGFTPDPNTARGNAGGPVDASTFGAGCRGFVPATPQHNLTVGSDFPNLRILVNSNSDTVLAVRTPAGTYLCNDDGGGSLNPLVEGAMGPGTYQIFVGMYSQTAPSAPYVIGFTENPTMTSANLGAP